MLPNSYNASSDGILGGVFMGEAVTQWASLGRVSTDEQFEEGDSCETQLRNNLEIAQKHGGEVYKEYIEDGISAFKKRVSQRPKMLELLQDIADGKVKYIAAYKRDRICRDPEDYYLLRNIFSKSGVKVYLTCGTEIWGDPQTNSPTDELLDGLMPLLAKFESMTTAQRVRSAMEDCAKRGVWRSGKPSYGYRYNETTKKVEQVPHQAEICRMILKMFVAGNGGGRIADILNNELKIPYESGKPREIDTLGRKQRDFWYVGNVLAIVKSPVYAGLQTSKGKWYPCAAIDPIFDRDEWQKAHDLYLMRINKVIPYKYLSSFFLFNQILYCSECGAKMIPKYGKHKYDKKDGTLSIYETYYYQCSGRVQNHNGCKSKVHKRDVFERVVLEEISKRMKEFDADLIYNEFSRQMESEIKKHNALISQLESQNIKMEEELQETINSFIKTKNTIMIEKLEKKTEELETSLRSNKEKISQLIANPPGHNIDQDQITRAYEKMKKWDNIIEHVGSKEEKRKLLLDVVNRIDVDSFGDIVLSFKIAPDFPISAV